MKLSTRARYGLRLCFLLGTSPVRTVPLSSLVRETALSEKYLEQILHKLKKGALVTTKRGAAGGYMLSKPPEQIAVNSILKALDDDFAFTDCATGNCSDASCPNKRFFRKVYEGIDAILQNTTLQNMIDDANMQP